MNVYSNVYREALQNLSNFTSFLMEMNEAHSTYVCTLHTISCMTATETKVWMKALKHNHRGVLQQQG